MKHKHTFNTFRTRANRASSTLIGVIFLFSLVMSWGAGLAGAQSGASVAQAAVASPTNGTMGPLVASALGRYFQRPDGKAVLLSGSHTWQNFQDSGLGSPTTPPPAFNYPAYLDFLQQRNHNFFRLWTWEQTRWTNEASQDDYWFSPQTPYVRTSNGAALDGLGKFDLTQFNQAYFDRMRSRVLEAGNRGMYVSVMLFDGWSIQNCKGGSCENNPWKGHPYNAANNVNGLDGDLNADSSGEEIETLANPQVTALQEAYTRKVADTVGDLDNVLYEITNEGPSNSEGWQYHMINYLKNYEASKAKQHPVGMTVEWPNSSNAELFNSPADWVSPNGDLNNPPVANGTKVILSDTDHLCGLCGDSTWVWKSFTHGENPIFMDGYDGASYGTGGGGYVMNDPRWVGVRTAIGQIRSYSERMDLVHMIPASALSSTGYILSKTTGNTDDEYLIYAPSGGSFTVNLSTTGGAMLDAEWLNPATGQKYTAPAVSGGSATTHFTAPFSGAAVLYLKQSANPSGLIAAYGFNNATNPLFDSSARANHASCIVGHCPAYAATSGHTGGAYNFVGANNYLIVPNESQFDFTKNLTVSTWMKVNGFTAPWETLITKGDSAWGLERYGLSNNADFATFSPGAQDLTGAVSVANNAWHHVAVTYDGSRKKLYVDGNLIASVAYTAPLSNNNLNVWLGFNQEYAAADYGGWLDDVRIYNRALSQAEIQADKNTAVN